jgi:hypothetical protein
VARQANAAMNESATNRLSSSVDSRIGNRAAGLDHTVYSWLDSQIPGAFDLASAQQLAAADKMLTQAADKRASAIDGYLKSRDNSRKNIADIDVLALAGRRRRQQQSAQTQAYYGNKALDFRMANPVYKGSGSLLSQAQVDRAQQLIRHDGEVLALKQLQARAEVVTQDLYKTFYGQALKTPMPGFQLTSMEDQLLQQIQDPQFRAGLFMDTESYKQISELNAWAGMSKGTIEMGYTGVSAKGFVYGANQQQALSQTAGALLSSPAAKIADNVLTFAGPAFGSIAVFDMAFTDVNNPAYNPDGWDYFREGGKNAVDWGMALLGRTNLFGASISLGYTVADYKLSNYEYRPLNPVDGSYHKRTGWAALGYSANDAYLQNLKENQRILGPNWSMHNKN